MGKKTFTETAPGFPLPLGAYMYEDGAVFSIFSRNAESVKLLLFHNDRPDSSYEIVSFDPSINKTGDIWHVWVRGVKMGQFYGYKISGPYEPLKGHRFNENKLLIDPCARALSGNFLWDLTQGRGFDPDSSEADLSFSESDSTPYVPRGIVISNRGLQYDRQLGLPLQDAIIYELHVRGFTYHNSSGVTNRGTFTGLTEKIPYLKELGITAVELMPVQEFDEFENIFINPLTGQHLKNYWGYSTLAFFAPKSTYCSSGMQGEQADEFRRMVKAFHEAGIEVILDIVFNHTCEGDQKGPTVSFRGIDNSLYYILDENKRFFKNYSGCGNTVNCNHPMVRSFILDVLRYWVIEMNIDGFRFDLASILGRDGDGNILSNPPLIERIEEDPILRNTKIIAEAWDAAGAYQVGSFPGRWTEWNGKYRDDVRRFWHGGKKSAGDFATRVTGSSDLYQKSDRGPTQSINFITCHDGFTLNDLVSYNEKHNIENGEDNRDGENYNLSHNFGIEGPDAPPFVEGIRKRQIKNFIATLFLSQGIPMICAGDEFRRTQKGNNNSYCQDNEISWVDWSLLEKNRDIFRFMKMMIRFRKQHPVLRKSTYFTGATWNGRSAPDISWHGSKINQPEWDDDSRIVAVLINGEYAEDEFGMTDSDIFIIFNALRTGRVFEIPGAPSGKPWKIVADTSKESPMDFCEPGMEPLLEHNEYYVKKRSTVVLVTDAG